MSPFFPFHSLTQITSAKSSASLCRVFTPLLKNIKHAFPRGRAPKCPEKTLTLCEPICMKVSIKKTATFQQNRFLIFHFFKYTSPPPFRSPKPFPLDGPACQQTHQTETSMECLEDIPAFILGGCMLSFIPCLCPRRSPD